MSMFSPTLFSGKRFAVVGLGKNGLPAALGLRAMGADVVAWDDNPASRAAAAGACRPARSGARGHSTSMPWCCRPAFPHRLPKPHPAAQRAIAAGVPILSDVELLFQAVRASGSRARFAGITGTNGKSTTTALLAHILERAGVPVAAGANLGPAALSLPLLPHDGVYVLEMSSYMLERLASIRFDAAAMLNLSADHIDRHGDMAGYAMAKRAIFDRQTRGRPGGDRHRRCRFARYGRLAATRGRRGWSAFPVPKFRWRRGPALPGAHNAQNAAAATAMARFFGVPRRRHRAGTAQLIPGLPHRQQRIVTIDGVTFINDSKATNADAAERGAGLLRPADLDRRRHGQGRRDRAAGAVVPAHRPRAADRPRRARYSPPR